MSLIIESSLDTLYQVVSSKSFVKAIFSMKDKEGIKKSCDGNKMVFDRLYNVKELENVDELKDIQIPENITTMMEKHLGHINIIFSTTQEIIHSDDNGFLIKYTSILTQPEFIYTIVGSARLILYVRMSVNKNDPEKITIHWIKRFVNVDTEIDDNLVLNMNSNNIIDNVFEDESLKINESVVKMSETFLGKEMVQECVLPYINKLFQDALNVIQDTYVSKLLQYLSKKHFKIYKKK